MRRKLIAGNWKMNGSKAQGLALVEALAAHCREAESTAAAFDLLVCPPFVLLPVIEERARRAKIAIGGQDCHPKEAGAHTGDISATMLADVGCSYVIVGHSERRQDHREDDALVQARSAVLAAYLKPIVCVGETQVGAMRVKHSVIEKPANLTGRRWQPCRLPTNQCVGDWPGPRPLLRMSLTCTPPYVLCCRAKRERRLQPKLEFYMGSSNHRMRQSCWRCRMWMVPGRRASLKAEDFGPLPVPVPRLGWPERIFLAT